MATQTLPKPAESQQQAPAPWRPWDFEQLRNEMMEMFDHLFGRSTTVAPRMTWRTLGMPSVNLFKENSNLILEAAVPGFDKKDIHINVTRDHVTISGESRKEEKTEKERYYHSELHYGSFSRSMRLPADVDSGKTHAELKDGVLRITMPILDPARHQEVKVAVK
ncbi:MAG: Hsp20/alpha crystallin family protein [Candidatus Eremiobacterota bacterium]